MPTFEPPYADTLPPTTPYPTPLIEPAARKLLRHYKSRARGRSVLRLDGVYVTVDYPSQAQIDAASEVYLGGHVYHVTAEQAAALEAAGYTVDGPVTAGGSLQAIFGLGFPMLTPN